MSFLAPWFLLGGLAIAGPILFHLIRRVNRERVPFSSILFLRPTPPKVTQRRRVEHFWLLLLRCLCLLLLAAAFARPFFSRNMALPLTADEGRQIVLLVDTSASMQREGLWEKARSTVEGYLEKMATSDQVALIVFDLQPQTALSFAEWNSWSLDQRKTLARQRVMALSPGWKGTQLGLALTTAAELLRNEALAGNAPARREVIVISDLQEGAKLDGLQGYEWPADVTVVIESLSPKHTGNAGVTVAVAADSRRSGEPAMPVARVTNARDSDQERFRLNWRTEAPSADEPVEVYVPPAQARTASTPVFVEGTKTAQVQLAGDAEPFDNVAYLVAPEVERINIAWLGSEAANDPGKLRYYFERVFPESKRRRVEITATGNNAALSPEMLSSSAFAVIPRSLNAAESEVVRDWLTSGRTALLVLTDDSADKTQSDPSSRSRMLADLVGLSDLRISEADGNFALLSEIDFKHPLFVPFADPRFSDFTRIHFWKHRRLEIPESTSARVLARFDDGAPALVQFNVGKGSLLVLTSGWNPMDSQLAVASKFPPLIQTMLAWASAGGLSRFQFQTGDSIPSPVVSGSAVEWRGPDGEVKSIAAGTAFTGTENPGIYTAAFDGGNRSFAVNLPMEESRTAPLSVDELAQLGVPLSTGPAPAMALRQESARHLQRAEMESRQKLWRWLIAGALAVTLGEILLSGWLSRRGVESGKREGGKAETLQAGKEFA